MLLEIDDRIADELAGTMEGDIAAPLDLEQLDATLLEVFRACQHVGVLRRAPQGDDRRVLDEQEHIVLDATGDALSRDLALERQPVGVRKKAEIDDEKVAH
jgi:hypothetical protein